MSELSSPRKSFSFFLSGNRTGHGNRSRPKPRASASGGFMNYNMPQETSAKEESDISTLEKPMQQQMTFRVLNPDPETSSSSDDDDDNEYEVIRPAPSSIIQEEKTTLPEEDGVEHDRSECCAPPVAIVPALHIPPTTPPPTESSQSSPDMRQPSDVDEKRTTATRATPNLCTGREWKVSNRGELMRRQSKILYEEQQDDDNNTNEQLPIERLQTTANIIASRRPSSSADDSSLVLMPRAQPLSPSQPYLPQQPLIFTDKRRARNLPRNTRGRPQQPLYPSYPQIAVPPPVAAAAAATTTIKQQGAFASTGYNSPSLAESAATRASVGALMPFTPVVGKTVAAAAAAAAAGTAPSKYMKASYSLTNHPDAIKIYRSMAEKTRDPVIQLTYAKYLLEISDLYDVKDDQRRRSSGNNNAHRFSALVQYYNVNPLYGRARSVDHGDDDASSRMMTASASRISIDSILSAPIAGSSNNSSSSNSDYYRHLSMPGDTARPARWTVSDENRRKKKMLEDEGIRWIKLLAKQNVGEAAYMMAEWHQHGLRGFGKNSTKALRFYKAAAAELVPEAMYEVAKVDEQFGHTAQALSNYRRAADKGVVEAIYRVARIHLMGQLGQRRNVPLGLTLLAQAAERATEQCPEPAYFLGLALTRAHPKLDIPIETIHQFGGEAAALQYLERAAQLGLGMAQTRIAFIYEYGLYGAPMNLAKSFAYYDIAAQKSDYPQSMLGLSRLYNHGCRGPDDPLTDAERMARDVSGWLAATPRDEDAAFRWCQKAADQGLPDAMFLLGWYYESGVGVLRDYDRATQLYTQAAAKGHAAAAHRLRQSNSVTRQQHQDTRRDFHPSKSTRCTLM